MKKHASSMMCMGKCIAWTVAIGSAIGAAIAVMIKMKAISCKKKKMPMCIRDKAATAMDTIGAVMQNLADMTR